MKSIIKFSIFAYVILALLLFYEINLVLNARNVLEKKVKGVSTQIQKIESYQEEISNFNSNY